MHDPSQTEPSPASRSRRIADRTNRLLSSAAGFVAVSALVVSAYQTYIMRQQQKMSAWPYLQLYSSNADGAGLFMRNVGLGPVLVRSVEVSIDGRPARRWGDVFRAVRGGDSAQANSTVTSDVGPGSVLLPGGTTEVLRVVAPAALVTLMHEAASRDRLVRRVCYCSLYQDCWLSDSRLREPAPVRACAVDSTRAFGR